MTSKLPVYKLIKKSFGGITEKFESGLLPTYSRGQILHGMEPSVCCKTFTLLTEGNFWFFFTSKVHKDVSSSPNIARPARSKYI